MDYARAIVEFFVERRGKGTAISSADEQLVMLWEEEAIPVSVVLSGIDNAFERKSEPPKSLSECGRWVRAAFKKWTGGDALGGAVHTSVPPTEAPAVEGLADGAQPRGSVDADLVVELEERAATGCAALREATAAILAEVRALADRGPLEPDVIAVIDEAIAEAALDRLPSDERARVTEAAEAYIRRRPMSAAAWAAARAREIIRALQAA